MILAFDTYYFENKAKTIAIEFKNWDDETASQVFEEIISDINAYVSGEFYKRELPCIISLLKKIDTSTCEAIIIDGFVVLDDNNKLGLGGYLFESLNGRIPIIGVGKNNFLSIDKNKRAILRGKSIKPLFITAKGIDLDIAADKIKSMHGNYRFPDLLKKVDSLGRL